MKIDVPKTEFPIARLVVRHPEGEIKADFDMSQKHDFDVQLPEGVLERECEVECQLVDSRGVVVQSNIVKQREPVEKPAEKPVDGEINDAPSPKRPARKSWK